MDTNQPELLLVDKPEGITSFDVIRELRRAYGAAHSGEKAPKFGHAGTLDPAASGLMLIGVGTGTKKLTDYIKLDKEYVATIALGASTTTGDRDGEVLESQAVEMSAALRLAIASTVPRLVGTHTLPVSAYSAIKKDGVPMYKRAYAAAKQGTVVTDVPVREMTVYEAELLQMTEADTTTSVNRDSETPRVLIQVRFRVGSGTYIRSLAEELGRQLGLPASLAALRRTKVGEFDIKDAQLIEKVFR